MPSARDEIKRYLDDLDLGSLADRAWEYYLSGADSDFIYQWIREQDEYKTRFSGLVSLREQGKAATLTESQYLQIERQMRQSLESRGLGGSQFTSNEYLGSVIANEVSADEFDTRVQLAESASTTLPADVRRELQERYGVDQSNVLSYYLDTDRVETELVRQQTAASIAAAYERFQTPAVGNQMFENLARAGVEYGTALQALSRLGTLGARMSEQERLEGAFGLTRSIDLERQAREASFRGGGSAATQQEGVSGLGSASLA